MQRESGFNEDQDATRIRMQRGSRCTKDQYATRIKMRRGSRCNKDKDATRIKMQRGSRCNKDQDEMKNNEEEIFLSYQLNAESAQFIVVQFLVIFDFLAGIMISPFYSTAMAQQISAYLSGHFIELLTFPSTCASQTCLDNSDKIHAAIIIICIPTVHLQGSKLLNRVLSGEFF